MKPRQQKEKAAPPPAGSDEITLPEIDWWAVNQSFVEEKGAIVLSGSAWVRYKAFKLEADHIVFFRKTREVYAEGHIRLRAGESEFAAHVAYMDIPNDRGYLIDATVSVSRPSKKIRKKRRLQLARSLDPDQGYAEAVRGERSLLSSKDLYGVYLDPVNDPHARLNVVFKAEKVIQDSRLHYRARNAFVTTDDMAEPMYGVKVRQLDMFLREVPDRSKPGRTDLKPKVIKGKGARIKVGPVTLFPFPSITYDMTKHLGFMQTSAGRSGRFGPFLLFRYGLSLGGNPDRLFDPVKLYLDVDNRLNRGPALGAEFKYKTGRRPSSPEARGAFERGRGHVRVYGTKEVFIDGNDDRRRAERDRSRRLLPKVDGLPHRTFDANRLFAARRARDGAGPGSRRLDLHEDDTRGLVDFGHHQPLRHFIGLDNVQLDFEYQRQSDRDFVRDLFPFNYLKDNQPEALASVRVPGDNYSAELLFRKNPQNFDGAPPRSPVDFGTFTEYQPALTYSLTPTSIGRGFYVSGEAQVAQLHRDFERRIIRQSDLDATRVYGRTQLQRPFRLGALAFRPHVGGQLAHYSDSRDGGATAQGAFIYGLDVSSRIYGTFPDVHNDELGVRGFRHIIEPRIEYLAVANTIEDPVNILDFDEVDDLIGRHVVRLSLDQLFQTRVKTKRGGLATRNIAGVNLYVDYFPRSSDQTRLLEGDSLDLFHINGFFRVLDALRLQGDTGINMQRNKVETAVYGFTLDPGGRWRLRVAQRFNFRDKDSGILGSDRLSFGFDFQLSERWAISFQQTNQKRRSFLENRGRQTQSITLSRRYGALIGSARYKFDRLRQDSSVSFSLAPAFAHRNLIVARQHLLVPSAEVEAGGEFSEERNFDPFNLTHKRRKKKRKAKPPEPIAPARPAEPVEPPPPGGPVPAPKPESGAGGSAKPPPPFPPAEAVPLNPSRASQPPLKKRPKNIEQDDWATGGAESASR